MSPCIRGDDACTRVRSPSQPFSSASGHWTPQRPRPKCLCSCGLQCLAGGQTLAVGGYPTLASAGDVMWLVVLACSTCCVSLVSPVWEDIAQNRVRMGTFVLVGQTSGLQSLLQMGGFRGSVGKCLYVAQVVWSSFLHTWNGWKWMSFSINIF